VAVGRVTSPTRSYTPRMPGAGGDTPRRERVGVLGGTFDPVHVAHIVAALAARHALDLDRVILMVAGDPWQKREAVVASAADRLAMTRAAVDDLDEADGRACLEVSAAEVERPGPTYTIDTLRALSAADRELFLIVGADVAARIDTWHRADEVRAAATLVVASRTGAASYDSPLGQGIIDLPIPRLDVSSTELRARVARGEPIDGLVPAGAVRVIRERRLYTRS
jgi:nicotinate-nucleotide adenylyltransferase